MMLQSVFNSKKFDRLMYGIHQSPEYKNMLKDKMTFNEMDAVDSNSRNEDFQKSFLYKIPFLREPLLASNRAADAFLNLSRMDIYMNGKKMLERQGITRENSPETYEELGKWAMNMTGRGNMLKALEDSHSARMIASNTFFGARLMASRFNLLNPLYYAKMPKAIRVEALKDMGTFTGMIIATGAAAVAAGATVSFDPDDADFLKIKVGNTKYDITGGLVQYIRTYLRLNHAIASRFNSNLPKQEKDAIAKKAGGALTDFFAYKLAPNTSYGLSAFRGKDPIGREFNPTDALKIYPMYVDDMIDAYKQSGPVSLATIGIPSILGVGVQTYADREGIFSKDEQRSYKKLTDNGISLPELGTRKEQKVDVDKEHENVSAENQAPKGIMTEAEFQKFNEIRKPQIKDVFDNIMEVKVPVKELRKTVSVKEILTNPEYKPYKYHIQDYIKRKTGQINRKAKREVGLMDSDELDKEQEQTAQ